MPITATEVTIRPNSACNDGSWRWLFAALAILSFTITIRFALLGLWMILRFTILEISGLVLVLWVVLSRSAWVEKVLIDDEAVEIRHLEKGRDKTWRFALRRHDHA